MIRSDPNALATHLEVALTCVPQDILTALQDIDSYRRRRATSTMAQHLADRLGWLKVTGGDLGGDASLQASLILDVASELVYNNYHCGSALRFSLIKIGLSHYKRRD